MKLQFITPNLHGALDFAAALGLIVFPFLLGLQGLALWMSVAGGAGLILYSLLTDYALGPIKLISFDVHLLLDLSAAVAFLAAPAVFGFTGIVAAYYYVMGAGVVAVVGLSERLSRTAITAA